MLAGFLTSAILYFLLRDVSGRPRNAGEGLPWRQAVREMGPLLIPLAGILIARAFMVSALTTYLPTFLSEEGADLWFAGAALSILEAAGVVGALLGGSISDRLGRHGVLFVSMLATPLLMFVFLAVKGWLQFPLLLILGFTALSVTPVVMALVQESYPENRALANGLYMALNFGLRAGGRGGDRRPGRPVWTTLCFHGQRCHYAVGIAPHPAAAREAESPDDLISVNHRSLPLVLRFTQDRNLQSSGQAPDYKSAASKNVIYGIPAF